MQEDVPEIKRISASVPKAIYDEIEKLAGERHMSMSGLIAELCEEYILRVRGTFCEACRIQNPPGSRFCYCCGRPISEDAIHEIEAAIAAARESPEFRAALFAILKKDPE